MIPKINGQATENQDIFVFPKQFYSGNKSYTKIFIQRMAGLGFSHNSMRPTISFKRCELGNQEYVLEIRHNGIVIQAKDDGGFYFGLITLFQMIAGTNGHLRCGKYQDRPRFQYRGVMLDVCRHFFSIQEVKKIIDQMSLLKLNKFHWHLSDDQGYRIESKLFPQLNTISSYRQLDEYDPLVERGVCRAGDKYGGYYTQEEIKEVIAYAEERFIEVIPEIELPGHSTAILSAFNDLTCNGEKLRVASTFGIHERIFCAGNGKVYEFVSKLLDEVCALFDSDYVHIGGDETSKNEWKRCSKCNAVMKKQGYSDYEQLQCFFTNKVIDHLKSLGKTPIVWNESAIDSCLDESAIIQYWMEMSPGESYVAKELPKGRKFILSNQGQFYCDYSYAETPLRATLNYEPQVKGNAVPDKNVLGIEAPMWTEWTPDNIDIEKMLYPRMLTVAECGWTEQRDTEDFLKRAKSYLDIPTLNILSPMPWSDANISGDEALRIIAQKILELSGRHGKMAKKQGKTAQAVVHDDAPKTDEQTMVWLYMKAKMEAAYSDEDIKKVLRLISEMRKEA